MIAQLPAILGYDGSFPGLLCAAERHSLSPGTRPLELRGPGQADGLFDDAETVERDDELADRAWDRLLRKAGRDAARSLVESWLSDREGAPSATAHCASRMLSQGRRILDDLSDPRVLELEKAARRSRGVAHAFMGLVRFSELEDGSFYAPVEPDCDILPLVAGHFGARFAHQRFAIHDLRRSGALLHDPALGTEIVTGFRALWTGFMPLSEREREIRALWRLYFDAVSIRERVNPGLQRSHMPKKYWKYLPEKNRSP